MSFSGLITSNMEIIISSGCSFKFLYSSNIYFIRAFYLQIRGCISSSIMFCIEKIHSVNNKPMSVCFSITLCRECIIIFIIYYRAINIYIYSLSFRNYIFIYSIFIIYFLAEFTTLSIIKIVIHSKIIHVSSQSLIGITQFSSTLLS